jgi:predicted DsbA family dithiol-disulfide isomerase
MSETQTDLSVEIWSDIMCPFCYIGKSKFEQALNSFTNKDRVQVTWKSYQLSPDMKSEPGKNINQYLAEHKGISIEEAKRMNDYVTEMAAQVGLNYNFDISILGNSFDAHRFLHYAKEKGKQNEAEELIFAAYFTEGKDIADIHTLIDIGEKLNLDSTEVKYMLKNNIYADDVANDIAEANQIGVRGVPFFVFDRKYAVSGAQDSQVFADILLKSFDEMNQSE